MKKAVQIFLLPLLSVLAGSAAAQSEGDTKNNANPAQQQPVPAAEVAAKTDTAAAPAKDAGLAPLWTR